MRACFHEDYEIPLPEGHPFPMRKFSALRDILRAEGIVGPEELVEPEEIDWDDLRLVHDESYLQKLATGTLDRLEERRLGLPWSPALVRRSRLAVQGTLMAGWNALEDGVAANLAGGTHHACPDHGEGFCVLNDVGVAIRILQREEEIRRAMVVDLDVHQGNGNAICFAKDPTVFTYSMHGGRNFPMRKPPSDLDVPLEDHVGDREYLATLEGTLPDAISQARPDIVFLLSGVDVVVGDRYGRLALTRDGLRRREHLAQGILASAGLPVVLVLSGGYAETPQLTADLHAEAHRAARVVFGGGPSAPIRNSDDR
ncbi:MAG: histone deacetylase [Phycisphaerae bacterium]|nr:histone deacetylase [Phycisphaerae bacterium]MBC03196.1 histone deacetylase [Phycisphaerae bacterium]